MNIFNVYLDFGNELIKQAFAKKTKMPCVDFSCMRNSLRAKQW